VKIQNTQFLQNKAGGKRGKQGLRMLQSGGNAVTFTENKKGGAAPTSAPAPPPAVAPVAAPVAVRGYRVLFLRPVSIAFWTL
jgi:hypothetical protein